MTAMFYSRSQYVVDQIKFDYSCLEVLMDFLNIIEYLLSLTRIVTLYNYLDGYHSLYCSGNAPTRAIPSVEYEPGHSGDHKPGW